MWMARPATPSAASLTASFKVGWPWQMRAMSSAEPPNSTATTTSRTSVPASGGIYCTCAADAGFWEIGGFWIIAETFEFSNGTFTTDLWDVALS